jgi:hypothetical protein
MQLMVIEPETQNQIINLFKENNIPVFSDTNKFDPSYPYLCWNYERLSQTRYEDINISNIEFYFNVEEFLSIFNLSLTLKDPIYEVY